MPTNGQFSITYTDYDGEHTNTSFRVATITAANHDAQVALQSTLISTMQAMVTGIRYQNSYGNYTVNNIGNATSEASQRELKWLVSYHDATTLKKYSLEIGTADTTQLDPNDRKHADIGDGDVVDAFVAAFIAYALTPDGNAPVVDEITLVGRPI